MDQSIMSQDSSREKQSKTNFEMFAATDGVLIVTEFHDIGRLDVKFGSCTKPDQIEMPLANGGPNVQTRWALDEEKGSSLALSRPGFGDNLVVTWASGPC
jgi:hypothetical protein